LTTPSSKPTATGTVAELLGRRSLSDDNHLPLRSRFCP